MLPKSPKLSLTFMAFFSNLTDEWSQLSDDTSDQVIVVFGIVSLFLNNLLNHWLNLLNNLSDRGRSWSRSRSNGSCLRSHGCSATNFNKVGLHFTSFGVSHGTGGVLDNDQVAEGINIGIFTSDISSVTEVLNL